MQYIPPSPLSKHLLRYWDIIYLFFFVLNFIFEKHFLFYFYFLGNWKFSSWNLTKAKKKNMAQDATMSRDPKLVAARVFIGRLPSEKCTDEELREKFEKHGKILGRKFCNKIIYCNPLLDFPGSPFIYPLFLSDLALPSTGSTGPSFLIQFFAWFGFTLCFFCRRFAFERVRFRSVRKRRWCPKSGR